MEPLILYFVLFFPGVYNIPFSGAIPLSESIHFSIFRELGRTITYTLPSLALIWYLISDRRGFTAFAGERPKKTDIFSLSIGIPGLILIGLGISFLVLHFPDYQGLTPPPRVEAPAGGIGWAVMAVSCLLTGYLEESFFRYYLITFLERQIPNAVIRIALSTLLFSACHIYEGPWGILNAVLAGIFLSILFVRYRSLHGIACAHGCYNIFVYIMGIFSF